MDTVRNGQRDFDFVLGTWHVRHRRLRYPLSRCDEWYEFEGSSKHQPLWGGKGNIEEVVAESPLGTIEGAAIRFYDASTGQWSIHWGTPKSGLADTPNVGAFNDEGVGEFFAREVFDGTPIHSRFRWTPIDRDHCRWEQHFSADNGATWELNWLMEFTRR
jgi:hypothetical protein